MTQPPEMVVWRCPACGLIQVDHHNDSPTLACFGLEPSRHKMAICERIPVLPASKVEGLRSVVNLTIGRLRGASDAAPSAEKRRMHEWADQLDAALRTFQSGEKK